jgi:uncharacterized protein YdhG (YjbR/CyaY superfamily)
MVAPATVEEYLASLAPDRRAGVETLRRAARAGAPEAAESIAYGMPALRSHDRQFLVSYAAFKAHYSLFPASEAVVQACGVELTPYLSGKGTIRFPADRPIPAALVTKIVAVRFAEIAARTKSVPTT